MLKCIVQIVRDRVQTLIRANGLRVLSNSVFSLRIDILTSQIDNSPSELVWLGLWLPKSPETHLLPGFVARCTHILTFLHTKGDFQSQDPWRSQLNLYKRTLRRKQNRTACRQPQGPDLDCCRNLRIGYACPSSICDSHRWYHWCCFRLQRGQYCVCLLPNLLNYG